MVRRRKSNKRPATSPPPAPAGAPAAAPAVARASRSWRLGVALLLAAVTAVAFANADHAEFVFDSIKLNTDPDVHSVGKMFEMAWKKRFEPGEHLSYVTFALSHALNRALDQPAGDVTAFVWGNIAVHAINGWLVYLLIAAILRTTAARVATAPPFGETEPERDRAIRIVALLAAVLFVVHPLQANSVTYIVQRRGMLAVLFYVAGLVAWLRFRRAPSRGAQVRRLLLVALCYLLAAKSKIMALPFPFAVAALELCLHAPDTRALRRAVPWLAAAAAVGGAIILWFVTYRGFIDWSEFELTSWGPLAPWGPWQYFLIESIVYMHYWKLIWLPWPGWMCIDHTAPEPAGFFHQGAWLAVIGHGALLAFAVALARRRLPLAGFGIALFYIALIPYVVLAQTEPFVEYKTYLGTVGAACIVAELLRVAWAHLPRAAVLGMAGLVASILTATTWQRNRAFETPVTIWRDVIKSEPNSPRGYMGVARELQARGEPEAALELLQQGAERAKPFADLHYNLGKAYYDFSLYEEAAAAFARARDLEPRDLNTRIMFGNTMVQLDRLDEAEQAYRDAISVETPMAIRADTKEILLARACFNLGNLLYGQRRFDEAETMYRQATVHFPTYPRAWFGLGLTLEATGRYEEAQQVFHVEHQINPDYEPAAEALQRVQKRLDAQGNEGEP